jgi:nucleobase:cation symporter-1, NCS1 family
LPFAGFVGTLGASVSAPATHLGQLGWMISFITSFVVYYVLCLAWPTRNQKLLKEMEIRWEQAADEDQVLYEGSTGEDGSGIYGKETGSGEKIAAVGHNLSA